MEYKLSEILNTLDFYGSTLTKPFWYSAESRKPKPHKVKTAPRITRKHQKVGR